MSKLREPSDTRRSNPGLGRTMTEEQLLNLARRPLFGIGAHTVSHPNLSALSRTRQDEETKGSKQFLEQLLGTQITSFSYPFGRKNFTEETEDLVARWGFLRACTTEPQRFWGKQSVYRLPRVNVPDLNGEDFARWLRRYARF